MFAYINTAICFIFAIVFFAIRNHPNGMCGIRFPCTLEHPSIWRKVHTAASVSALPCCFLDLYGIFYLTHDSFLILSWIGVLVPIGAGCIATAILSSRQERQEEQRASQQRKTAEQEESSPKF